MSQNTGQLIALKIDLSKIDKARLFQGKNGAQYLDAVIWVSETADQYGNCGMITQSVTKEERLAKVRGAILGNGKILSGPGAIRRPSSSEPKSANEVVKENLPF